MGLISSYLNKSNKEKCTGFKIMDTIPEEILIHILSFLPEEDLLNISPKVCRQWRDITDGHTIWKIKCEREKRTIPPSNAIHKLLKVGLPDNFYRMIYLYNPYGRNLIRNSSGETLLKHWEVSARGGDGWRVENPPAGADRKEFSDNQFCFATSYERCEKSQVINLLSLGVGAQVLDEVQPTIHVEEWYAARFDCGAIYELNVKLYTEERQLVDEFNFHHEEMQWTGRAWAKVEHDFKNYGKGVRWIIFTHTGRDTQFWKGHYGSKMANALVKLQFDT